MNVIDRILSSRVPGVSTAVTTLIAGWFALTFALTVGGLIVGA